MDGKYHDVDSSALAFEIAAKACFREGMKKASPIILEPIMDVEVTTPQDHVGDVVGDLNRRRGVIQNQESSGSTILVRAQVYMLEVSAGETFWDAVRWSETRLIPALERADV